MNKILGNTSYKQKTILLISGFILLMIVSYHLAFKETIKLKDQYKQISREVQLIDNAPGQIRQLENQLTIIRSQIGKAYNTSADIQEELLEDIAAYCQKNRLMIREVPKVHIHENLDYVIETSNFIIEGRFIPLLKLLDSLEKTYQNGKVISADFRKQKDIKTKRIHLTMSVYLQNIKQKKHEN